MVEKSRRVGSGRRNGRERSWICRRCQHYGHLRGRVEKRLKRWTCMWRKLSHDLVLIINTPLEDFVSLYLVVFGKYTDFLHRPLFVIATSITHSWKSSPFGAFIWWLCSKVRVSWLFLTPKSRDMAWSPMGLVLNIFAWLSRHGTCSTPTARNINTWLAVPTNGRTPPRSPTPAFPIRPAFLSFQS